jgi:hypothetical protein
MAAAFSLPPFDRCLAAVDEFRLHPAPSRHAATTASSMNWVKDSPSRKTASTSARTWGSTRMGERWQSASDQCIATVIQPPTQPCDKGLGQAPARHAEIQVLRCYASREGGSIENDQSHAKSTSATCTCHRPARQAVRSRPDPVRHPPPAHPRQGLRRAGGSTPAQADEPALRVPERTRRIRAKSVGATRDDSGQSPSPSQ